MTVISPARADIFWSRIKRLPSGCWEYSGVLDHWGYGRFWLVDRHHKAHRIAYELTCGPIPDGMVVMHACDNPPCCNPDHLSLGTHADNARDRHAKGRTVTPPAKPAESFAHGTRPRYRRGCRCEPCRTAERARKRPYEQQQRSRRRTQRQHEETRTR